LTRLTRAKAPGGQPRRRNMTREEIEALRKDPRHRRWGILYFCKGDPGMVVPKRIKWLGWTLNFAHPGAIPAGLGLAALLLVPVWVAAASGFGIVGMLATEIPAVLVVCLLCSWLSSRG
jgi:hypothetical protein